MTPTFTYEQAVLLSHIPLSKGMPQELCVDYTCNDCPINISNSYIDMTTCPFSLAYLGGYSEASTFTRRDMRAQFPPEAYPELYI